jgi:hypothetical protein
VVGAATLQGSTLGAIGFNGSNEPDAPPVTRVGPVRFIRFFRGRSEFRNGSTRSLCRPKRCDTGLKSKSSNPFFSALFTRRLFGREKVGVSLLKLSFIALNMLTL